MFGLVDKACIEEALSYNTELIRMGVVISNREGEVLLVRRKGSDTYELPTGPLVDRISTEDTIKSVLLPLGMYLLEVGKSLEVYQTTYKGKTAACLIQEVETRGEDVDLNTRIFDRYLWVDPENPYPYLDVGLREYLISIA